jgi:peptidyl-prolyl cis-trans isomerase C
MIVSFGRAASMAVALGCAVTLLPASFAGAQDIAKVNGKGITEADLALADAEIGSELGQLPPPTKRRLLVEYVIENYIFADAAEAAKLGTGPAFEQRMAFLKRRALRDLFFDTNVKGAVKDADAKAFYDEQVKLIKPEEEVNARHILVEAKEKADEIAAKLKAGGDFVALAKENSKDPGSKDNGGDLGFFGKGQMVPVFEETAYKLNKGEVSAPVQSQFGWHIIKLEDKRTRAAPPFEAVKERIVQSMVGQKAQTIAADLRGKAKIEYVDADIKKMVDAEAAAAEAQKAGKAPEPAKK